MTSEPYRPTPGHPVEIDPRDPLHATGVQALGTVLTAAADGSKHPGIMFRFLQPDGTYLPPIVLFVTEPDRLTALLALIAAAGETAFFEAENERRAGS